MYTPAQFSRLVGNEIGLGAGQWAYWEKLGLIHPQRDRSGRRVFTAENVEEAKKILKAKYDL